MRLLTFLFGAALAAQQPVVIDVASRLPEATSIDLQALCEEADSHPEGALLYFRAGEYRCSTGGRLKAGSKVAVKGDGVPSRLVLPAGITAFDVGDTTGMTWQVSISGMSFVTASITQPSASPGAETGACIRGRWWKLARLDHLWIRGWADAIVLAEKSSNANLSNIEISGCAHAGCWFVGGPNFTSADWQTDTRVDNVRVYGDPPNDSTTNPGWKIPFGVLLTGDNIGDWFGTRVFALHCVVGFSMPPASAPNGNERYRENIALDGYVSDWNVRSAVELADASDIRIRNSFINGNCTGVSAARVIDCMFCDNRMSNGSPELKAAFDLIDCDGLTIGRNEAWGWGRCVSGRNLTRCGITDNLFRPRNWNPADNVPRGVGILLWEDSPGRCQGNIVDANRVVPRATRLVNAISVQCARNTVVNNRAWGWFTLAYANGAGTANFWVGNEANN